MIAGRCTIDAVRPTAAVTSLARGDAVPQWFGGHVTFCPGQYASSNG